MGFRGSWAFFGKNFAVPAARNSRSIRKAETSGSKARHFRTTAESMKIKVTPHSFVPSKHTRREKEA
jgi:hypothetical protein